MNDIKLSKRLSTVASLVRNGAFVADIGTDHGYLPIYLMSIGTISGAVASDVNKGPLHRAQENILKYSFDKKIFTKLANGLDGIDEFSPTDIMICGMGGELIATILDRSEYIKKSGIRLILQPMTSIYELREYLSSGFSVIDEKIVCEDGKIYQIICAEYDGKSHSYTKAELELGKRNIEKREDGFYELLNSTVAKKEKKRDGLALGGYPTEEIDTEIKELKKLQ